MNEEALAHWEAVAPKIIQWLLVRIPAHFIKPQTLSLYLEEPATGLCPLSGESRPHNSIKLPYDIFTWGLQGISSHQSFPANCLCFLFSLMLCCTVKCILWMWHNS